MRNAFADEITKLGVENEHLVLLSGDIGNRLFDRFKEQCTGRFYNCGVAEANMVGVSAGLAMSNLRPVVYTITPFITTRVMEQIRIDLCYHDLPVVIVGTGSGLSYASLGPTHHSCEDMAMLRTLAGMSVLAPGDPIEVRSCIRTALQHDGPVYIRIGKKGEQVIHKDNPDIKIGESITIRNGNDICLLAVGVLLPMAIEIAEVLAGKGISARVVSVISIKPLDNSLLDEIFSRYSHIVTIEEHGLIGGFGSAVAEWLVDSEPKTARLVRFGVDDAFIHESGETDYIRESQGLSVGNICKVISHYLDSSDA